MTTKKTKANDSQKLPSTRIKHPFPAQALYIPRHNRPIFPGVILPIEISKQSELQAIKEKISPENPFFVTSLIRQEKLDQEQEIDNLTQIYPVGCIARALRANFDKQNRAQLISEIIGKVQITKLSFNKEKKYIQAHFETIETFSPNENKKGHLNTSLDKDTKAYVSAIVSKVRELTNMNPIFSEEMKIILSNREMGTPRQLIYMIAGLLTVPSADELQILLEDQTDNFDLVLKYLQKEIEVQRVREKINKKIEGDVSKQQRDFFLREQLKLIQNELGLKQDEKDQVQEKIKAKLEKLKMPKLVEDTCKEELEKLGTLDTRSSEYHVVRQYLDWISDLPWGVMSEINTDLKLAKKILDEDHYGLEKVKEKLLTIMAVEKLRNKQTGSIILLLGPPGVGKTSLGKSIARATGRKFHRFSLGGMRDEAEIRGHRRTYVGAMPGKFLQSMKVAGTSNPILMLDEIDKVTSSYAGDPSSALLEVLDPEQNSGFVDLYLDLPFDLSKTLFIATANQLETIPAPLLDRMEIIELSGYLQSEKVEIAKRYILPKAIAQSGLGKKDILLTTSGLKHLIDKYAREAGMRSLEKLIKTILGKIALKKATQDKKSFAKVRIDEKNLSTYLGKPRFSQEQENKTSQPGVVSGLAWTAMGGATFSIEAIDLGPSTTVSLKLTGSLGKVMEESAMIALSYICSILKKQSPSSNPSNNTTGKKDIPSSDSSTLHNRALHLHVPSGATPKDGPSAGITMALAFFSLAKNMPIRKTLTMTGELTLSGKVLPIGGVREKIIAAKRIGKKEVILPEENKRDFEELPKQISTGLKVKFVSSFEEVIAFALPNIKKR